MQYEIEHTGLTDFTIRFQAVKEFREDIVDTLEFAARTAATVAHTLAKSDTGALRSAIYFTPPKYRPGGAGGGGHYEAEVGINETLAPHAAWLIEGTGFFGPRTDWITPKRAFSRKNDKHGNPKEARMMFQKKGEPLRFRTKVAGQPPHEFWEEAQKAAHAIIAQKIARI